MLQKAAPRGVDRTQRSGFPDHVEPPSASVWTDKFWFPSLFHVKRIPFHVDAGTMQQINESNLGKLARRSAWGKQSRLQFAPQRNLMPRLVTTRGPWFEPY